MVSSPAQVPVQRRRVQITSTPYMPRALFDRTNVHESFAYRPMATGKEGRRRWRVSRVKYVKKFSLYTYGFWARLVFIITLQEKNNFLNTIQKSTLGKNQYVCFYVLENIFFINIVKPDTYFIFSKPRETDINHNYTYNWLLLYYPNNNAINIDKLLRPLI